MSAISFSLCIQSLHKVVGDIGVYCYSTHHITTSVYIETCQLYDYLLNEADIPVK